MGKRSSSAPQELAGTDSAESVISISPENVSSVRALIANMVKIKADQEALNDDIKAVADRMGVKPAAVKEMANIILKEQEKGGVLSSKEKSLDFARQVLEAFDRG